MSDLDIEAHLIALADEMKGLIAENFARPSDEVVHTRLREIRAEIFRHGWMVTWTAGVDVRNPRILDVEVLLWKPKQNLSPADQKIYDDWFNKINTEEGQ